MISAITSAACRLGDAICDMAAAIEDGLDDPLTDNMLLGAMAITSITVVTVLVAVAAI